MKAKIRLPQKDKHYRLLLSENRPEEAIQDMASVMAGLCTKPELLGKQLFIPEFDLLLQDLSTSLFADDLAKHKQNNSQADGRRPIVVVTELVRDGGHSRLVEDFLRVYPNAIVIATGFWPISTGIHTLAQNAVGDLPHICLPIDSAINNARRLRTLIDQLAQFVVLFTHHHDVVAHIALSSLKKQKVVYSHHSDHRVSLGATIKTYIHQHGSTEQINFCKRYVDAPFVCWPPTAPDKGAIVFSRNNHQVITASSGSYTKYDWASPLIGYPQILAHLLASGLVDQHVHIGHIPTNLLTSLRSTLSSFGLTKKFEYVAQVDSVWEEFRTKKVSIYIGSFPIFGARTSIEAQGCGLPMIVYRSCESESVTIAENLFYNDSALTWSTLEELLSRVEEAISNHLAFSKASREYYLSNFSFEVFAESVMKTFNARQ